MDVPDPALQGTDPLPQPVRDAFARGQLAVLVGSGPSVAAGLPKWSELPERLLQHVEAHALLDRTKLNAFRALFQGDTPLDLMLSQLDPVKTLLRNHRQYQTALTGIFRGATAEPNDLHRALVELDVPLLATTNYDNLIELAERSGQRAVYTWQESDKALADIQLGRKILFKVHGTAEREETVVMTESEYAKVRAHDPYQRTLSLLLQSYTFLFLGYGNNDPFDIDLAFKLNSQAFRSAHRTHYALIKSANSNDRDRWQRDFNVRVIPYGEHQELPAIIRSLRSEPAPAGGATEAAVQDEQSGWAARPAKSTIALAPEDILDLRAATYQDLYYERAHDAELRRHLEAGRHVIVIGNSLSGKTRSVFEALKRQADSTVIFPTIAAMQDGFRVPDSLSGRLIAFIDDIDDYCAARSIDAMLTELMRRKVQIVATCRTGPEHETFESKVTGSFRELARSVLVKKVTLNEARSVFGGGQADEISWTEFDGNVGSLFLPLRKMRDRYRDLLDSEREVDKLSLRILSALKVLYLSGNCQNKSTYASSKLFELCERMVLDTQLNYGSADLTLMQREVMKLRRSAYEGFVARWPDAIRRLQSDIRNLNFLEVSGKFIRIEEAYLELIVDPHHTLEDTVTLLEHHYPEPKERERKGFFVRAETFNAAIRNAPSQDAARQVFADMKSAGIRPTRGTYQAILSKMDRFCDAVPFLDEMTAARLSPTSETLLAVLSSVSTYEDACSLLDRMQELGQLPEDTRFAECLRSKPFSKWQQLELAARLLLQGTAIDAATALELVQNAASFEEACTTLSRVEAAGHVPTTLMLISLLVRAPAAEQARAIGTRLVREPVPANQEGMTTLQAAANETIRQAQPDTAQALDMLARLAWVGVVPHTSTFRYLVNRARHLEQILDIVTHMRSLGLTLDVEIGQRLIERASSFDQAMGVLEELEAARRADPAAGSESGHLPYGAVIQRAETFERALTVIARVKQSGTTPTRDTLFDLQSKASSFADHQIVLELLRQSGHEPDANALNRLLGAAPTMADVDATVAALHNGGFEVQRASFNALIARSPTYADAVAMYEKCLSLGFRATGGMFQLLILKAADSANAEDVLNRARQAGYSLEASVPHDQVVELVRSAKSAPEALTVWRSMLRRPDSPA